MPLSSFLKFVCIYCVVLLSANRVYAVRFDIFTATNKASIYYDRECSLDSIAANLLADDIERISGYRPFTSADIKKAKGNIIIIGSVHAAILRGFVSVNELKGSWERYAYRVVTGKGINKALVICGSDFRGTAYGVFELSSKLGVSPWYWWADVKPVKRKSISIDIDDYTSASPSVKYRGIFINDEDWGLQPWAAKTFEPETGDIGPKTYAKVFELLLRLKANLIWPAMHPSTRAFFHYPGNVKTAGDYQVIIGSSHAEPMLRNNVGEWNKSMGPFNYLTNKDTIFKYWEDRVKESSLINGMYTIGMRGVHDSGMEGVKDPKEAARLLERIFADQRGMLAKYINRKVPQVFTAYKEVLDIYDHDLKLPEDVTLVWPDDNYGYIHRLNSDKENQRPGGSGVYYHASYWGRPHDYLWLSTTHPALIVEEMTKAYEMKADKLWVLNVGDIKPLEYNIQLFLDMAYDTRPFKQASYNQQHLFNWAVAVFGEQQARRISNILWKYYDLAFERRPEFMGWSQTEPTTKTTHTNYNHFSYGDEAQKRIDKYDSLVKEVQAMRPAINTEAFYQLVYYPVVCASWMNKKFLYLDKAYCYGKQGRISAYYYAAQSVAVYDSIVKETSYFNDTLNNGKWKGIISMKPRNLPVFEAPQPVVPIAAGNKVWDAIPEGYDTSAYVTGLKKKLPTFNAGLNQSFFIDVFLCDSIAMSWNAVPSAPWIKLSAKEGKLMPTGDRSSCRIWVHVDRTETGEAFVDFTCNGTTITIPVSVKGPVEDFIDQHAYTETNGLVSIYGAHTQHTSGKWERLPGLGYSGAGLKAISDKDTAEVAYTFYCFSFNKPTCKIYTLPVHPVNAGHSMRYGISIDNAPIQVVDIKTVGRSEEWKQNVLRNSAVREVTFPALQPGKHTIRIHAIDPGLVLDRILIDFENNPPAYSAVPETYR